MDTELFSKNKDKLYLTHEGLGVVLRIIPYSPPKPDALDVFQLNIRFTNAARISAMLRDGGKYTADKGGTTITVVDGEYVIRFPFTHDKSSIFQVVLGKENSEAFAEFFKDVIGGISSSTRGHQQDGAVYKPGKVGRNNPCPCGSGKKYKKCCFLKNSNERRNDQQFPDELRPLAETNDPSCQHYVTLYSENPTVISDSAFWEEAALTICSCGQPEAALACLERARQISPKKNSVLVNMAATLAMCEDHLEALKILDTIPRNADRRAIIRANCLQGVGQHEEAIEEYFLAIKEEPKFYLPYVRLLNSLKETGSSLYEYWLMRAVTAVPEAPWVGEYFVRFCQSNRRIDDLADAVWLEGLQADIDETVMGRDKDVVLQIIKCQVMHWAAKALRDQSTEGLRQAITTLKSLPGNEVVCNAGRFLAEVSACLGNRDGVLTGWNSICENCKSENLNLPENGLAFWEIYANINASDFSAAVALCEELGGLDANDKSILDAYWWALDEIDRTADAIPVAEKLVASIEDRSPLFYNLGYLCGKDSSFGKSKYYYEEELKINAGNVMAWENLAFIHLLKSDVSRAEECFTQYQKLRDEGLIKASLEAQENHAEFGEVPYSLKFSDKDKKFEALLKRAIDSEGSMSYALDLIDTNESTSPLIGSSVSIKPVFLTPEKILDNLSSGDACIEEIKFQATTEQQKDASYVLAAVEEEFPHWRELPEAAKRSLVEAEKVFRRGTAIDSSPYIVAYAKSVEICLYELVFKSFKKHTGSIWDIEKHINTVLVDPKSKAIKLARFVDAGYALELGTMTFLLQLCTGRTARRIALLSELQKYIVDDLRKPQILDKDYLQSLEDLASRYRNKAAHEKAFGREECQQTRQVTYTLLGGIFNDS